MHPQHHAVSVLGTSWDIDICRDVKVFISEALETQPMLFEKGAVKSRSCR